MNDFILFTSDGKSVTLKADRNPSLFWVLRKDSGHSGSYKPKVQAIESAGNVLKEDR